MIKKLFMLFLSMFFITASAFAHDAWVEKKDGKFIVVYGHGDNIEAYDTGKVKEVKAYSIDGSIVQVMVEKEGYPVIIKPKGKTALISLFFDNGFWSKTPDGWKNKPKKEVPDAVESSHSMKYSKAILKWSDKFSKPLGMKMEIVPLKNPLSLKAGDSLPLKVFLDGKPVEGASVNAGGYHKEDLKTDKNGMAEIKIEKSGFQIVAAGIRIPLKDNPNADVLSLSANITFEVK
jgi:nickel transport protein